MKTSSLIFCTLLLSCHSVVKFPNGHVITGFSEAQQMKIGGAYLPGYGADAFAAFALSPTTGVSAMASFDQTSLFDERSSGQLFEGGFLTFKKIDDCRLEVNAGLTHSSFHFQSKPATDDLMDDGILAGQYVGAYVQPSFTFDQNDFKISLSAKNRLVRLFDLQGNLGGSQRRFSIVEIQKYYRNHFILEAAGTLSYRYKNVEFVYQGVMDYFPLKNNFLFDATFNVSNVFGININF